MCVGKQTVSIFCFSIFVQTFLSMYIIPFSGRASDDSFGSHPVLKVWCLDNVQFLSTKGVRVSLNPVTHKLETLSASHLCIQHSMLKQATQLQRKSPFSKRRLVKQHSHRSMENDNLNRANGNNLKISFTLLGKSMYK